MRFQRLRLAQIDSVSWTEAFPRLDDIEHGDLMAVSEKFSHNRLAEPPRSSCDENAHISAANRAEPAALVELFEQAVVDEFVGLSFLRFFPGNFFKNFRNTFSPHVWNTIATVMHAKGLIQLRQSLRIDDLGIF